ncbi:MAG: hypothetical protein LDLANPLL_02240 [Turneriella sp.]|nr:hypothetical protein [Turneriella sp.]
MHENTLPNAPENLHTHPFSSFWDKIGIAASLLCLLDCLVLPLASILLMSIGSAFAWTENMHTWLLPLIALTSSFAFYHSWKAHRSYSIVSTALLGFLLLVAGEFLEIITFSVRWNWLSFSGSLLIIVAHLRNLTMHAKHRISCKVHSG